MDDISKSCDLEIACYRFSFRVTRPITLPTYKGSTFHGGFGHALNRIGRRFRDYFYAPPAVTNGNERRSLPKPFMLIPPLEEKTHYAAGDEMQCGLFLFGDAVRHFMIAFAALESLGKDLGLGRNEGRYRIESVEQLTLDGAATVLEGDTWFPEPYPVRASEVLSARHTEARRITLSMASRIRLKNDNLLVKEAPPFRIFFDRIIGRINSLAALYGSGMLMPPFEKRQMLRMSESVIMDRSRTTARWVEWARPPKDGKEEMSFGGLLGDIVYVGELAPFVPWVVLGQWTGVGGKTSFGLGKYIMEIAS